MEQHCAMRIDETGTPSVIGPFDTIDEATAFANDLRKKWDGDDKGLVKIAGLSPVPDWWEYNG